MLLKCKLKKTLVVLRFQFDDFPSKLFRVLSVQFCPPVPTFTSNCSCGSMNDKEYLLVFSNAVEPSKQSCTHHFCPFKTE